MNHSFVAISDIHLGWKLFNLPELAQDLKEYFARVVDIAISKKVNYLIIAGDLFDTNRPSPDVVSFVSEQVKRLSANGIIALGIAGDHDKPVNDKAWVHLSGILPIAHSNTKFAGFDYCDDSQENVKKLNDVENKERIEWLVFHGQVPELFKWCEDKKKLDFKDIDIFKLFPNLKGVILGDIHVPYEGSMTDPSTDKEVFIGYCGSLGVIKTDEIGTKKGLLYYDGNKLQRIKFDLDRQFIRVNLKSSFKPINWIEKYASFFNEQNYKGKKPVFIVEYDRDTKHLLSEIGPLTEVGVVRSTTTRKPDHQDNGEKINIRSELKTKDRIAKTLSTMALEKPVYDLMYKLLLATEPKEVLDEFKEKYDK